MKKAASLAALVKERLGVEAVVEPGKTGQFDVFVDGEQIASRGGNVLTRVMLGAGFPDLDELVEQMAQRGSGGGGAH